MQLSVVGFCASFDYKSKSAVLSGEPGIGLRFCFWNFISLTVELIDSSAINHTSFKVVISDVLTIFRTSAITFC